ncbi:MAG: hypothetical protein J6T15_07570 [Bacilli bacterium]|nr:hypothetical protein [Bacilli bacterium]
MRFRELSLEECKSIQPGEVITVTTVMAVVLAAVIAVVVYRLFRSGKGTLTVPGGWKFDWK